MTPTEHDELNRKLWWTTVRPWLATLPPSWPSQHRTRSQAANECDACDSHTDNAVVNGCLLCDQCAAMLPDPAGLCHGPPTRHGT